MDHLLGNPAAAQMDFREVVEELLMPQIEGFKVQRQIGRGLDELAVAAVLGRYVSDVAVAHTSSMRCGHRHSPLRPVGSSTGQHARTSARVDGALMHHSVGFQGLKLMRPPRIVTH